MSLRSLPLVVAGLGSLALGCGLLDKLKAQEAAKEEPPVPEPVKLVDAITARFPADKVCGETATYADFCALSKLGTATWTAPEVDQHFIGTYATVTGDDLSGLEKSSLIGLSVGATKAGTTLITAASPDQRGAIVSTRKALGELMTGKSESPDLPVPALIDGLLPAADAVAGAYGSDADGATFSGGGAWHVWRVPDQTYGEAIVLASMTGDKLEVAVFPLVGLVPAPVEETNAATSTRTSPSATRGGGQEGGHGPNSGGVKHSKPKVKGDKPNNPKAHK